MIGKKKRTYSWNGEVIVVAKNDTTFVGYRRSTADIRVTEILNVGREEGGPAVLDWRDREVLGEAGRLK